MRKFSHSERGVQHLIKPVSVAVAWGGEKIVVADQNSHTIWVFDSKGSFLYHFGREGEHQLQLAQQQHNNFITLAPTTFRSPCGVAMGEDGRVVVVQTRDNKVFIL